MKAVWMLIVSGNHSTDVEIVMQTITYEALINTADLESPVQAHIGCASSSAFQNRTTACNTKKPKGAQVINTAVSTAAG